MDFEPVRDQLENPWPFSSSCTCLCSLDPDFINQRGEGYCRLPGAWIVGQYFACVESILIHGSRL